MPPQCLAMIPDSEIAEDLIDLDIQDYCGTITDPTQIFVVALAVIVLFLCLCFIGKVIFDGLEEDVIDDKECMRDGVYRGPE